MPENAHGRIRTQVTVKFEVAKSFVVAIPDLISKFLSGFTMSSAMRGPSASFPSFSLLLKRMVSFGKVYICVQIFSAYMI